MTQAISSKESNKQENHLCRKLANKRTEVFGFQCAYFFHVFSFALSLKKQFGFRNKERYTNCCILIGKEGIYVFCKYHKSSDSRNH